MKINIFNKSKQKGFTLVEMIVSMAIFTVVAVIAVGALLKVMDANRKSLNLKTAINNLNFALESMSREMRVGGKYYLTDDVEDIGVDYQKMIGSKSVETKVSNETKNSWILKFVSSKKEDSVCPVYIYRLQDGKLQKAQASKMGGICSTIDENSYYDLISPDIKIVASRVEVNNSDQPYATFWFKGSIGIKDRDTTEFSIQTRVSQRIFGFEGN